MAAEASDLGFRVAWGRCWEAGGAPAFWPWSEVFRGLRADDPFATSSETAIDAYETRFRRFENADVFGAVTDWIRQSIPTHEWQDIVRRAPQLVQKGAQS